MKQLFRFKPKDYPKEYEYDAVIEEDRKRTDDFLSKYFEIVPIEMTLEDIKLPLMSSYFRDNFTEVGNSLVLNRSFIPENIQHIKPFQDQFFKALITDDFKKKVFPTKDDSCHAAFYLETKDFLIVSSKMSFNDEKAKIVGLNKPYFFFYQTTTPFAVGLVDPRLDYLDMTQCNNSNGHIDTRIGILESAKIIYLAPTLKMSIDKRDHIKEINMATLDKIVKEFGYKLREYPYDIMMLKFALNGVRELPLDYQTLSKKFTPNFVVGPLINGINFITEGDKLFTSYISESEKKYLAQKSIEVIKVPIKYGFNGAGLRCVYGEVNK
jgi:hypothetical protein